MIIAKLYRSDYIVSNSKNNKMIILKKMAISEFSRIFNLLTSELLSVNPIEIFNIFKDDKSVGKLVKPSRQNYNTKGEKVEKDMNDNFGLFNEHFSTTLLI